MTAAARTHMEAETREIPQAAARLVAAADAPLQALAERLRDLDPRFAVAAGRGSSDAAALLAKYLFETRLGLPTVSAAPSVTSVYRRRLNLEKALVLAISQSGRSPDLIEFCCGATGPDVLRVGLINDPASPLASTVDLCLALEAGQERSVAATKSCVAAILMVLALTAHWANDGGTIAAFARAPAFLAEALEADWEEAERFLAGDGPIYVVGRGPGLAIAAEAALKLKETNGLHAEAVSAAELRHGPLALAAQGLRVIVFAQKDAAFENLRSVAGDLGQSGVPVLLISSDASAPGVHVPADAEPVLELVGMLTRFYLAANAAALTRGLSPDNPPFLTKITETR